MVNADIVAVPDPRNTLLIRRRRIPVKGGVKLDHWGGEKVDYFLGSWGFVLRDLRGRLECRPATRFAGRV
jgi:hypothetical protein